MSMLTLFESRYTLKGMYNMGHVGKTASMGMLTHFESRYTLKGMYNIGDVGKTASISMLTLFKSRYTAYIKLFYDVSRELSANTFRLVVRIFILYGIYKDDTSEFRKDFSCYFKLKHSLAGYLAV